MKISSVLVRLLRSLFRRREVLPPPKPDERCSLTQFKRIVNRK